MAIVSRGGGPCNPLDKCSYNCIDVTLQRGSSWRHQQDSLPCMGKMLCSTVRHPPAFRGKPICSFLTGNLLKEVQHVVFLSNLPFVVFDVWCFTPWHGHDHHGCSRSLNKILELKVFFNFCSLDLTTTKRFTLKPLIKFWHLLHPLLCVFSNLFLGWF